MTSVLDHFPDIAINGMGRIGRSLFRVLYDRKCLHRLKAVNDIMPKENLIYLLKYDTVHGTSQAKITETEKGFSVDGHEICVYKQGEIENLPWRLHQIAVVVESSGLFTAKTDMMKHLKAGAGKVLLSTYSPDDIPVTIMGVNEELVKPSSSLISPGDCTINCVAPVIKIIQDHFGIDSLHINIIQAYTSRQELVDGPYKGLRRGRAAGQSIIPFPIHTVPILERIFPGLREKINAISTRVPVACGALADLAFTLKKDTSTGEVNGIFSDVASTSLSGIMNVTYDPIVSSDILGNTHSSVIDANLTSVVNYRHLKVTAWFDNEWAFASRLFDWLIRKQQ
jgi:glyceraldehyde 3-phosphate dehydrogenase